jgi:hypothetical protein
MRSLVVVEGQEALEGAIDSGCRCEEAAPEGDPPVFVEDGSLESLDEAVGPAVTRLGAGVVDAELGADGIEEALELAAVVGEDALEPPSRPSVGRQENTLEEPSAVDRLHRRDDLGESEGTGGVTGRDLPERANALELADVEAVQADQIARQLRFDVSGTALAGLPEAPASTLGEKAGGSCAVMLENGQSFMPRSKPDAPKQTVDGTGSYSNRASSQLRR